MAILNDRIWRRVGLAVLVGAGGAVCGCEQETEESEDGLVSSMFRGDSEEEKETVVVVIDRSREGGDEAGSEESEGAEAEEIDLEKVNVVFVYADGMVEGAIGGQVIERASFPVPDAEDMRFGGEWVRRVVTDDLSLEMRMEMRPDGSYLGEVDGERFEDGSVERARVEGIWDARGDEVIVQVHETSNPRLFPKGMIEVLAGGRVADGVWTFLDSRGVRRTARRQRLGDEPAV